MNFSYSIILPSLVCLYNPKTTHARIIRQLVTLIEVLDGNSILQYDKHFRLDYSLISTCHPSITTTITVSLRGHPLTGASMIRAENKRFGTLSLGRVLTRLNIWGHMTAFVTVHQPPVPH